MPFHFSRSRDGILRCNVHISLRLDKEEVASYEHHADLDGRTIHQWLNDRLRSGIAAYLDAVADDEKYNNPDDNKDDHHGG